MLRSVLTTVTGAVALGAAAYELGYRPWRRRWLAGPEESARGLPGDALVPDADFNQTMAITIDAPASAVWPWLLQMGYGRAGWYSYDAIDMIGRSVRDVRLDLQQLEVGETIPFAPGMGFRVEILEPQRALVLYADSETAAAPKDAVPEAEGAGLKLAGLLSDANASAFRLTWAFVLEPAGVGRTRLLERFRTRATAGPATPFVRPVVDVGHFLMTRKHLLGIRERAEQPVTARAALDPPEVTHPAPDLPAAASDVPVTPEPAAVGAA
jgi:hypothetical protein